LARADRLPDGSPMSSPDPEAIALELNATIEALSIIHQTVSWGDRLLTLDKVCGFRENAGFARALSEIRGSHQYDQYNGPDGIAWRLNTLVWAAQCALRIGGSFVECGVFKGDMSWVVAQSIGPERIPQFLLFDSFEGFSPRYSSSADFPDNPAFLDFANKVYREEGLYEYVRDRFAPFPNFKVIKGFLPDALDNECPDQIGYLHIDLNSPTAEVKVLERLFDLVRPGGIIIFDDYGWKVFRPQKNAEDMFMRERGYDILELPSGQGLVVRR
jgi:O-methyltransferase